MPGEWFTTAQAADNCLSRETLARARATGLVTPVAIAGVYWWEADDLIAWIKARKAKSSAGKEK